MCSQTAICLAIDTVSHCGSASQYAPFGKNYSAVDAFSFTDRAPLANRAIEKARKYFAVVLYLSDC